MAEEKNARKLSSELGVINIADEVVSTIAGLAAKKIEGVASMKSGIVGGIASSLKRQNPGKGVKVDTGEEEAVIDLSINVKYGYLIPDVSQKIQKAVRKAIEDMTGLKVAQINIYVQGLDFAEEEEETA